jgi:PadR family transcriptional regulator AphA
MDVKTVCLGILSLGDATGYEIKKQFEDGPFSHFFQAGFGSIYPALNALLADGLVTRTEAVGDGRADRKVYAVTPAGAAALTRALADPATDDRIRSETLVMLSFAERMTAAHRAEVFDAYVREYQNRARRLDENAPKDDASHRAVIVGLGRTIYAAIADYMTENRDAFLAAAARAAEDRGGSDIRKDAAE